MAPRALTSSTPAKPTTNPAARRRVIGSPSPKRAINATKKGDEFNNTAATAAPARAVPTLIPTCVSVVLPNPIAAAPPHSRRVRGRRLPINGKIAVSSAPPTSARSVAIVIGDVYRKAESVTGYTTPAATIDTNRIPETGKPDCGMCSA